MLITPDRSECADQITPGDYKVRIKEANVDEWAARDGKPATSYVEWTLETFDEPEVKNNGRFIRYKTPLNGKGAFRISSFYRAATGTSLANGASFDTEQLLGRTLLATVGMQRDTEYTEVKAVKSL